jgi:hypothetical protein
LTEPPTAKEQMKLGSHQMVKRLFNSEVNLVSDWVLEHKLEKLSNKRYKHHTKNAMKFVFQEDPQLDLAGDILHGREDISQIESGVKMEPLDGAKFI